jgi:hypothetical protein
MTVRVRVTGLLGVTVVAALALSGCSGSSHNKSAASSGPANAAASSAAPNAAISSPGVAASAPAGSAPAVSLSAVASSSAGAPLQQVATPAPGTTPKATAKATAKATSQPSASKSPSTPAKLTPVPTPTATASPTPLPPTATPTVGGVTVALSAVHTVTSSGTGQGAISGQPAVQFTLTFANKGGPPVALDNVVTVADANNANAWSEDANDNGDDSPASGTVSANQSVSGKYVFVVPAAERGQNGLKILITVNVGSSPATFMSTVN